MSHEPSRDDMWSPIRIRGEGVILLRPFCKEHDELVWRLIFGSLPDNLSPLDRRPLDSPREQAVQQLKLFFWQWRKKTAQCGMVPIPPNVPFPTRSQFLSPTVLLGNEWLRVLDQRPDAICCDDCVSPVGDCETRDVIRRFPVLPKLGWLCEEFLDGDGVLGDFGLDHF